ncbi:MAG: hypothetical protein FWD48_05310 [Oscillospiraceae bacterium]|nr:hypothetical protein [Oscillospiraceae bacterium]
MKANKNRILFALILCVAFSAVCSLNVFAEAPPASSESQEGSQQREFPRWFKAINDMPAWVFDVDIFPDWFYDLPAEPAWFREINRIPAWFFTLESIPGWFYPVPEELPESDIIPAPPEPEAPPVTTTPPPVSTMPPTDFPLPPDVTISTPGSDELDFSFIDPPDWIYDFDDEYFYPWLEDDLQSAFFRFDIDGGRLYMNIPDGFITSGDVVFSDYEEQFYITHDGVPYEWYGGVLREHGEYAVYSENDSETPLSTFRIVKNPVNSLEYLLPDGFIIRSVSYNGEYNVLNSNSQFTAEAENEGTYIINVYWAQDPAVSWENVFVLKTAAPVVYFDGLRENMTSEESVLFWSEEPNVRLTLTHNGSVINTNGTASEPGHYVLTAADEAGNTSVYNFRIFYTMNVPTVWVIIFIVSFIGAVAGYVFYCRHKTRVR